MQLGFVGTGVMGTAIVRCLLEAGHQVTVHDRRREATAPLCALGAQWAEMPRAVAAESEVVCTSLPGPPEVEHVVFDKASGLLAGLHPGSAYIDLTTNAPPLAQIIPVSAGASRMFEVFPRTVFSGAFASDGTLDIVAKDLRLACELAYDVQAPCRIGAIVAEVLQRGQAQGLGQHGFPNVVRVLEQMAGAQLRVADAL